MKTHGLGPLSVRTISYLETGRSTNPYRRSVLMLADALSLSRAERALLLAVLNRGAARPDSDEPPDIRDSERSLRPAQLPSDIETFVGRAREIDWLCRLLAAGRPVGPVPIATITGAAGLGKSALAKTRGPTMTEIRILGLLPSSNAPSGRRKV